MNWIISLTLDADDSIEKKLERVLDYIFGKDENILVFVSDIEATGKVGVSLTRKSDQNREGFDSSKDELLNVVNELGQIFELEAYFSNSKKFIVIVRDGGLIDFLGDSSKPSIEDVGAYVDGDLEEYKVLFE
jgi:hypothetical protein